jgi:hypothetical protein
MSAMGFTPDDSDENKANEPENSADFAAMMKDMQEKIDNLDEDSKVKIKNN